MELRSRRATSASVFALVMTATALACVGSDPDVVTPAGPGATSGASGGTSTSGNTTSGANADASNGASCVPGCANASSLRTCGPPDETCQFGCSTESGGAHCMQIDPSGPITPGMLTPPNVADVTLKSLRANALDGSLPTLREANTKATDLEVKNGIGFQRMDAGGGRFLSVWMFKSFLIPKDVVVHFSNENPVAFVATTDATIVGVIDVRPYNQNDVLCGTELISGATLIAGGPGGGTGAILGTTSFAGQGVGGIPASGGGPGGGGYGFKGQDGGELSSSGSPGGAGGAVYGNASLDPLLGGSGGGGATVSGGGGGGAFQLVAGHMVVIGDGTAVGGINAGGCGGLGSPSGTRAGAGGSGGSILIETPLLDMRAKSGLAANGGNAGIIGGANGADTQISADRIATSLGVGVGGAGGIYGGGNANSGNPGNAGGGSVGRIRLNLRASSYTLPAGAILSPSTTSFAGSSPTSIGTLDIR